MYDPYGERLEKEFRDIFTCEIVDSLLITVNLFSITKVFLPSFELSL